MSTDAKRKWTVEEYLAMERASEEKHEFLDGEVRLMSEAGFDTTRSSGIKHHLIVGNALASLHRQLGERPLSVLPTLMRLKVNNGRLYTYCDVSVVHEPAQLDDDQQDTLLNPIVIIEVLSPSTERYDRGKKFQHYLNLDSLQEYVLIAQDQAHIERYRRQPSGEWLFARAVGLEAVMELSSIESTLALTDIYNKISFEPDEAAPPT